MIDDIKVGDVVTIISITDPIEEDNWFAGFVKEGMIGTVIKKRKYIGELFEEYTDYEYEISFGNKGTQAAMDCHIMKCNNDMKLTEYVELRSKSL